VISHTFLPPSSWASMQNPDFAKDWSSKFPLHKYDYNPAKANQMLDAAGWTTRDANGTRVKGNVKLEFDYAGNFSRFDHSGYQIIPAGLRAVGITTNIKYIPPSLLFGDDGYLARRQHDLVEYATLSGTEPSSADYEGQNIPTSSMPGFGKNYS